jgi:hypothetical protein
LRKYDILNIAEDAGGTDFTSYTGNKIELMIIEWIEKTDAPWFLKVLSTYRIFLVVLTCKCLKIVFQPLRGVILVINEDTDLFDFIQV